MTRHHQQFKSAVAGYAEPRRSVAKALSDENDVKTRAQKREAKGKKNMKVSGRGVRQLSKIIKQRAEKTLDNKGNR